MRLTRVYTKSKKSNTFMTMNSDTHFPKILGTATLNEKGQLVIPAAARVDLGLAPGSKVVIMSSPHRPALVLIKAEEVEAMVKDLADALNEKEVKN
jgi:AbrB family looped-hinge helix DNA binding protein